MGEAVVDLGQTARDHPRIKRVEALFLFFKEINHITEI